MVEKKNLYTIRTVTRLKNLEDIRSALTTLIRKREIILQDRCVPPLKTPETHFQ